MNLLKLKNNVSQNKNKTKIYPITINQTNKEIPRNQDDQIRKDGSQRRRNKYPKQYTAANPETRKWANRNFGIPFDEAL